MIGGGLEERGGSERQGGKEVTLSARPEDDARLQEFLLKDLFG